MDISNDLLCLFSTQIEERDDSYIIEVPEREITAGTVDSDAVYRVALLPTEATDGEENPPEKGHDREQNESEPPVEEGERRTVEIEDLGEQGDGIARVDRGYVIIVPETELRERVTIEITDVTETVAFGDVIERDDYYE